MQATLDKKTAAVPVGFGVEIGQILFIAVVLGLLAIWRTLGMQWPAWAEPLPVYGMGWVATFWFLGRFTALF